MVLFEVNSHILKVNIHEAIEIVSSEDFDSEGVEMKSEIQGIRFSFKVILYT